MWKKKNKDKSEPPPTITAEISPSNEESVEVASPMATNSTSARSTKSAAQQQDPEKESGGSSSRKLFYILLCLCCVLIVGVVLLVVFLVVDEQDDHPSGSVASCGDCHCIYDANSSTCPSTIPQSNFSTEFVQAFRDKTPLNAIGPLTCDPYQDSGCDFDLPLSDFGEDAVCGIHYMTGNCTSYKIKSYDSRESAQTAGAFITHENACGACSTTQDMSVYMELVDMTTYGTRCGVMAVASIERGSQCFQDLGFTKACADIWTYNARHTSRSCALTCLTSDLRDEALNGDAPTCPLNDCLQCDEDESGPIFQQFAGRTRRSSGLLSAIARECTEIAQIKHRLCPLTTALLDEDENV